MPILESNTYVSSMEYSPLIGGFAITLNDGRAAYLTANSLKFDPNVSATYFSVFYSIQNLNFKLSRTRVDDYFAASTRHLGARFR